jgi:hypothetical protein
MSFQSFVVFATQVLQRIHPGSSVHPVIIVQNPLCFIGFYQTNVKMPDINTVVANQQARDKDCL